MQDSCGTWRVGIYYARWNMVSVRCGLLRMLFLSLESSICEAFANKHHEVTVFFDLEKAYDTAWRHGI